MEFRTLFIGEFMSEIIRNLREKYPHNATYLVNSSSVVVFPDLIEEEAKTIGSLVSGQTISIETVIILPDKLFPDWWVWGSLANAITPKYVCMRKPIRNAPPKEYMRLDHIGIGKPISESDVKTLRNLLSEVIMRIDTLIK